MQGEFQTLTVFYLLFVHVTFLSGSVESHLESYLCLQGKAQLCGSIT